MKAWLAAPIGMPGVGGCRHAVRQERHHGRGVLPGDPGPEVGLVLRKPFRPGGTVIRETLARPGVVDVWAGLPKVGAVRRDPDGLP
jgi:hypothetical protein